jgi:hypothetical protein
MRFFSIFNLKINYIKSMQSQKLDIVELIELNPITKLSKNYQGKFIKKIQENFTESQQQLFIASFYCYLNYNTKTDFVIELGDIWKWLGFSRKEHCKVVLEKHFSIDIDYKIFTKEIFATEVAVAKQETRGGHNKEKVLITIHTFKKLCLKSNTKKADEIHEYFIKLEELTHETITEESLDLKLQLEIQQNRFIKDKQHLLLNSYHLKCIVYIIKINNTLYKFGNSDDIKTRFRNHRNDINGSVELIFCIESKNNVKLENELKKYLKKTNYRKEQIFNNKIQTELIEIDDITIIQDELERLNEYIKKDKEYLVIERLKLEIELAKLKNITTDEEINEEFQRIKNLTENTKEEVDDKIIQLEELKNITTEDDEIDKKFQIIKNLTENTKEEVDDKIIKLEELKIQQGEKLTHQQKYRQTEKYRMYISTDEFKKKENDRYHRRKETDAYKECKKKYYKNNIDKINATKTRIRKAKLKTTIIKSEYEKNKFREWLSITIKYEENGKLIWGDLLDQFLGYHTSSLISSIYKTYFIEYTSEIFPTKYHRNGGFFKNFKFIN